MDDYESLSHSVWECKYHVVFIPEYRKQTLYGELRRRLGDVFRTLAKQKLRPQAELRGAAFLARGYVSAVGRDEATIREYIRNQEAEDKRQG
jgi:REP-associated tyrosine transposase